MTLLLDVHRSQSTAHPTGSGWTTRQSLRRHIDRVCILRVLCYRARTAPRVTRMGSQAGHGVPGQLHCGTSSGLTARPSRIRFAGLRPSLTAAPWVAAPP